MLDNSVQREQENAPSSNEGDESQLPRRSGRKRTATEKVRGFVIDGFFLDLCLSC